LRQILSNANLCLTENFDNTLSLNQFGNNSMKKMPRFKVTKKKEENKKIERIIEILHPVPEQKESKLSNTHNDNSHLKKNLQV
jgi:hypothetical protein